MIYGYMRVSTRDKQEFDSQEGELRREGAVQVFSDRMSGKSRDKRPGLATLLETVQAGDQVVVWSIDRLARSLIDFETILGELRAKGVGFWAVTQSITMDPTREDDPAQVMLRQMVAAVAQFERSMVVARVRAGLAAAREQGRVGGRKPKLDERKVGQAKALLATGSTVAEVAKIMQVHPATIYSWIPAAKSTALGIVDDEQRAALEAKGEAVPVKRRPGRRPKAAMAGE